MVLDGASERRFHSSEKTDEKTVTYYTDVPLGMYIVRGDSIVLLGQVGSEEEEDAQVSGISIVTMKKLEKSPGAETGGLATRVTVTAEVIGIEPSGSAQRSSDCE